MIFTDRKITIRNGKSSINEPVILYRGDYEVSIKFTIMESKFRFKSGVNLVDSEKASHGQLAILAPYGGNVFSDVVKCEDGTVTFTLTKEMIDQLEEVGLYSFQIRLFDYYRESRVSIPPVEFGIEVREPVASEDHDNSVNNAIVGYSIAKYPISKVIDGLNEDVPDTFDTNGQYNKTDWETGDRISQGKLNKIEDALDKINQNEINDKNFLNKQMTSNFNVLQNQIDNMVIDSGNTDAEVEQARGEYNLLNQRLNAMDETDVELASQLAHNMDYILNMENNKPIEIESLRSEGISDDDLIDLAIQQVASGNRKCIKLSARTYNVSRSHAIENLANKSLIKGISIIGEGYGTVIKCMSDISEGVFNFKIPSNQQNVVISNIRFEFNGFNVLGVNFNEGGQIFRAENLIFLNTPARNGIGLKTGSNTTINNVVLEKIYCHNLNTGLEVSCDASIIDKCIIRSCNNGIIGGEAFMAAASSINISNTEIAQCVNSIYYSGKTTIFPLVININNCRIESSEGYDIYLEGYDNNNYRCRNINIKGCYITNVGKKSKGIELHRSLGCTIIGNLFKDFDTSPVKITTMQECWGMANTTIGGNTKGVFSSGISLINLLQNSFTNGENYGIEFRSFVKVGSVTTLPKASSEYRGRIITVNAPSNDEDDKIYICKKMAGTGVYEWVEL